MDISSLNRRAAAVSRVFNILATVVLVVGVIAFLVLLFAAFTSDEVVTGIALAIGAGIYTILAWAGIQLSSIIAGYVYARTGGETQV